MPHRPIPQFIVLFTVLLLSACSSLTPKDDFQLQTQRDLVSVESWSQLNNTSDISYLNDLFNSPQIDSLLTQALSGNPSLQQSLLVLEMQKLQQSQTSAQKKPQVDATISGAKQEDTATSFNSSLAISWQADLWGKLQDASYAAQLDVEQQQNLVKSTRDSLGADILNAWLQLIAQKRAVTIEQQRLTSLEQNESFIIQRYRNGLGTLNDLDSARTSVATSRATLESTQQQYRQNLRNLNVLVGQLSTMHVDVPDDYPTVAIAPITLPSQTLAGRPDLQAAYLAIAAAHTRAQVAYKELLPSFSLQAMLENTATSLRDALFVSPVWSLLGQLTAPLYQGGQLRADAEIADLETAYAYQSYKSELVDAVIEVENTIDQEKSLSQQLQHLETALDSATSNLKQYQQSYRTGLVDMLDLLTVQQQTYDLESQVNTARFDLLSNRINLALALGLEIKQ